MVKNMSIVCISFMFSLCLIVPAFAGDAASKPCPWSISSIQVGKWGNGRQKNRIWVKGSFPIPPGGSERPVWYVNGQNVGHSTMTVNGRSLPNASHLLNEGRNTVQVKFVKPPFNGSGNEKTISGFSWDKVPNGGYQSFK